MRRELNELEYFTWCMGQPYNLVVAVHVRGVVEPGALRRALDAAQTRHPLLRANVEVAPGGVPWLASDGVGPIPLAVVEGADEGAVQRFVEAELAAPFELGGAGAPRPPLLRVALLLPRDAADPTALVLTAQHVIADGLSMAFLFRDLLRSLADPDAPVAALDAPARDADLLPPRVRRGMPRSARRFRLALRLARAWAWLRFGGGSDAAPAPSPRRVLRHRSWELGPDETARLRARCRREGVSVQSAICAALSAGFPTIQMPVDLRSRLARPVGEAFGFF
ncbi:MAG TPA: condensation domain-containing protein, partial [Anaeromyxobacteraceae bacterium]|nr:condensation domain-containing protein [Anaeromyxobacteraceae bacterium]